MRTRLAAALHGARYPVRGLALLVRNPPLWPWAIAPILLTAAGMFLAIASVLRYAPALLGWLWPLPPEAGALLAGLWWGVAGLLILALATVSVVAWWMLSGLLATPFLDQLSQQVELLTSEQPAEETTWAQMAGDLLQSVAHTLLGLLLWGAILATLFVLGVIPLIGPLLQAALSLTVSALMICREMMDGAMSRRRMGFLHKLRTVRANGSTALGFGLLVLGMLWIPLMNLAMLPIAVTAGTLLFLDLESEGRIPD